METELPAEGQERDSEFGKVCPEKHLAEICFQHSDHRRWIFTGLGRAVCKVTLLSEKKGFYGIIFCKGACAAGKEKTENKALKGYRFLSDSLVMADVGDGNESDGFSYLLSADRGRK